MRVLKSRTKSRCDGIPAKVAARRELRRRWHPRGGAPADPIMRHLQRPTKLGGSRFVATIYGVEAANLSFPDGHQSQDEARTARRRHVGRRPWRSGLAQPEDDSGKSSVAAQPRQKAARRQSGRPDIASNRNSQAAPHHPRRRKRRHGGDHANHERWLVSRRLHHADVRSLFTTLYAISTVDGRSLRRW